MYRPAISFRLTWALCSLILWICTVPTLALPPSRYPNYRTSVLPSESPSNNTTSSATLEKRANDPTYDEASYVWFVNSNDIYAVAESANQFQDLDSAVAKLTLSNLNNGNHKTEGGFGKIYGAVREKNGGEPLEGAAKKAKGRDAVDGANLQKSIDSINVASIEGVYWEPSDESSLIFMDKLSENLQEQLNALKDDTSGYRGVNYKDKVQLFLDDIMSGVRDTHASSIAHRDIKLENIMYKDESCAWQLIDFDNAKKESDFGQTDSFTGSELYRAPEMLDGAGNYNPYQADVYSLAWAHYDMLNPKLLLEHQDKRVTLMSNVRNAAARGSWKDVATALKAEFATTSMTSKDFPKAWLDTKVIAQGLMAEGKRISTQQYYKGFCDIRQIPCNSNSDSWNAGGNTVGSNYQPN